MISLILYLAHLQAILIPTFIGIKSLNKFKHIYNYRLIPPGFICFGFGSMFEMLDHFNTDWVYINHSSIFNWIFYSSLSLGLTFLSISILKKRLTIVFNIVLCILSISVYWPLGKDLAILFQVFISAFLIINWQKNFKDYLFLAYPIFGILLTTLFGINLVSTNNQVWHILIGPSGSISVIIFYSVLIRSGVNLNYKNDKKLF